MLDLFFLFPFFLRNKDNSAEPRGGVYGLLLLIIVLLSLPYLPATCPSMDSSRPRPWGVTYLGPLFVSRCPWGTDWRGAPVMVPGHELFE